MQWEEIQVCASSPPLLICSAVHQPPPTEINDDPDVTGFWLWRPAACLARVLYQAPGLVRDRDVAELACGCALPSAAAARLGARTVLATDAVPAVLALASANVAANGPGAQPASAAAAVTPVAPGRDTDRALPHAARLRWGSRDDVASALASHPAGFDVVLASDALWLRPYVADDILAQAVGLLGAAAALLRRAPACRIAAGAGGAGALCPAVLLTFVRRLDGMGGDVRAAAAATGLYAVPLAPPPPPPGAESAGDGAVAVVLCTPCAACAAAAPLVLGLGQPATAAAAGDGDAAWRGVGRGAAAPGDAAVSGDHPLPRHANPLWCRPPRRAGGGGVAV